MDDHSLALRSAVIARLKADAGVGAIVGGRVYDEVVKGVDWPFIRYGLGSDEAVKADGWHVRSHAVTIHAFAEGPGRDNVSALMRAIYNALNDSELPLEGQGVLAMLEFTGENLLHDTPQNADYHGIMEFEAVTVETAE